MVHENLHVLCETTLLVPSRGLSWWNHLHVFWSWAGYSFYDLKTCKNKFSFLYWSLFYVLYELNKISRQIKKNVTDIYVYLRWKTQNNSGLLTKHSYLFYNKSFYTTLAVPVHALLWLNLVKWRRKKHTFRTCLIE